MRRLLMLSILLLAGIATHAQATLWLFGSQSPILFDPTVGPDGSVYYATMDNKIASINDAGVFRWKADLGSMAMTPIAMHGGMLFLGTSSQQVRAYSTAGNMIWKVTLEKNIKTPIAVSSDGILFFADIVGNLYAVNGYTGTVKWKFFLDVEVGPPFVGRDGTVYVVSTSWLNAINPANGNTYWRRDAYNFSNVPLVMSDDGQIAFIRRGGFVDVYDQRGNYLWEAYDDSGSPILAQMIQPVVYGNLLIFATSGGGDIKAMDLESGATVWTYSEANSGNPLQFSPAVGSTFSADNAGTLYWCDGTGTVTWLDISTGWVQGWFPSHGVGQNFVLTPRDSQGYGVIRTGNGSKTLVGYSLPAGPAGPFSQYLGSGFHQARFDDPPVVTILSPGDGDIISGMLDASVSASDDYHLAGIELYLNKTLVASSGGSALTFTTDSAMFQDGVYDLKAVSTDNGGNQTAATVTVAFVNPTPVYPASVPPMVFSWLSNGVDGKYRVDISTSPTMSPLVVSSATDSKAWVKGTVWQPSSKKWRKVQDTAYGSPYGQTTFYWRVTGKTGGQLFMRAFILAK